MAGEDARAMRVQLLQLFVFVAVAVVFCSFVCCSFFAFFVFVLVFFNP